MAVIDSKKLLPSGSPGGAIAESQRPLLVPASNISYKKSVDISQKLLKPADRETQGPGGSLVVIKKNVLEIKDIISNMYLLQRSEDNRKRKLKERQEAEEREKQLEKKPEAKEDPNKLPKISLPGRGILDTINRFLAFTFAGFLINNYSKYLPKLLEFVKYITPVTDFIGSFAKNLVNGVITFVDLGYKAYDQVNKTIESIGGKDAAKTFDDFSSKLNVLLNGSIVAAMLIASTAPKKVNPKVGFDRLGRRVGQDTQRRYLQRYGERQFADRFGKKNLQKLATSGATKGLAKGAARQSLRSVVGVPIIGSLIGFVIDTVVFREKPTRAAAGAVGSAVGQGIGIALAGGTTFGLGAGVGMFIGGFLGDIIGKSLYDSFAGSNPEPTQAKAQGGQVTSGQSTVTPTRRIKAQPTSRRVSYTPTKVQPGKDAGGKFKIEELYGKDEPGKRSALRALKKSSDDVKKMRSLSGVAGGMLGAGIDMALGQKPDRKLANSLGNMFGSVIEAAVNAELNSSFDDITRTIAMANGGMVPFREIGSGMSIGEKIGKYISSAFAIALESSAAKVLRNLNQEFNLEGGPPGGMPPGPGGGPLNPSQQQAFELIRDIAKRVGSPNPEVTAAIAMLESGWLANPNSVYFASGKTNPFGQTGRGPKGSVIGKDGQEHAVYNSLEEGVKAHVDRWKSSYIGKTPEEIIESIRTGRGRGAPGQYNTRPGWTQDVLGIVQSAKQPSQALTKGAFASVLPKGNPQFSSAFGSRFGRQHEGIDIGVDANSPVTALEDGKVVAIYRNFGGHGDAVVVEHSDGTRAVYGHVNVNVREKDKVKKGQIIATVRGWYNAYGNKDNTHLHLERRVGGVSQDPSGYLNSLYKQKQPKPKPKLQASLAPSQSSREIASLQTDLPYNWYYNNTVAIVPVVSV